MEDERQGEAAGGRAAAAGWRGDATRLRRLGEQALYVDGALQDSRRLFDAAFVAAEAEGRVQEMALAALGLGGVWVHEQRSAAQAAGVEMRQRSALRLVDEKSSIALRLRARLTGEADYREGGHDAILAIVHEASQVDDMVAWAEALSIAHHCLLGPDHVAQRLALAQNLLRAGSRTGRRVDVLMGLLWRTVDLFLAGDAQAERSLGELRSALVPKDHLAVGFVACAFEVMIAIRGGRFEEAEALAAACAERGAAAGDADATGWYGAQLVTIRWYQGRSAELIPTLTQLVNSPTLSAADNAYFAALAYAAGLAGDRQQAACALARLRGAHLGDLVRSSSWLVAVFGAVEAAHLLGDGETSAEAYDLLLPYAGLPVMASLAVACLGSTHHALGVASLTVGAPDRAVEHFQMAVRHNHVLGHWPAAILSRHRLGQALARRDGPGDALLAANEMNAAAKEARRLGMLLPDAQPSPSVPGPVGAAAADGPLLPVCRRRGRQWHVQLAGRSSTVADCVGMGYLERLLGQPGREIPAIELAIGGPAGAPAAGGLHASSGPAAGTRQPVLDGVALRDYRRRLAELESDLEHFESMNDLERAMRAGDERDWLLAELSAAAGLGGRVRHFHDDTERARVAVTKAIRRAIDRLSAADPLIGDELRARVQTGQRCCFRLE